MVSIRQTGNLVAKEWGGGQPEFATCHVLEKLLLQFKQSSKSCIFCMVFV